MSRYRIVCTDQVPFNQPLSHAHIVAVGIDADNDGYADQKQSKEQVIAGIRRGDTYFTIGNTSGKEAVLEITSCHLCRGEIIKTTPDYTRDNNLDHMRRCHWTQ